MEPNTFSPAKRSFVEHHWLLVTIIVFGLFNLGAWLAPLFMQLGWNSAGNAVYTIYSPLCHQMAQRSFFLFGEKVMYTADQLPVATTGNMGADTLLMRRFRGNNELGWKIAWSDRMVYMYSGMWLAMIMFAILSRQREIKPLSIWMLGLALLPMAIDGITHMISDFDGLFGGFRYHNAWLETLTENVFPDSFYVGDSLGSFNSLMRLISGLSFGFGTVFFAFPYLQRALEEVPPSQPVIDKEWIREYLKRSR
ncbi:MAG: DUF2085 domain-containing protein [Anaerolineae bacterium]|nr:DUF2085 domain-containing protein [Anaerolineae bacterium]